MYPWNQKFTDTDLIKLYNQGLSDTKIAKVLKVNQTAIWLRRHKVGLPQIGKTFWSKEETKKLIELYPNMPNSEIAKLLHKSIKSIMGKARRLRLRKTPQLLSKLRKESNPNGWKQSEIKKLRQLYSTTPNKDLVPILNRSLHSIRNKAEKLRLYKRHSTVETGKKGEEIASKFFKARGWQITQTGNPITPYDFIVHVDGQTIALNVKNFHNKSMAIDKTNLLRLSKFEKSGFFFIVSLRNRRRFFILSLKEVN